MPTNAHDEIVLSLLEVLGPLKGEIRLLGRVNDPVIGNPSEREIFLIVPDLHLLSPQRRQRFKYGFNHSESGLLARLLGRIAGLRDSWEVSRDRKLVTVQIGDFFDLWREFPGSAKPADISDDACGDLRDILYRGIDRGESCLKATMLLGNHDTKRSDPLQEISFRHKFFNRPQDGEKPFLFGTHGDAFDILETMLPDAIQEFAVYFIGAFAEPNKYPAMEWSKQTAGINKSIGNLEKAITDPEHSLDAPDGAILVGPEMSLPPLLCQEIASPDGTANPYFEKLYRSIDFARQRNLPGQHVSVVTMGHTHQASLILCRPGGERPMVLMDVGAWIENCTYSLAESGTVVTEPSAQLGVIHGNDARIYQIRLPQGGSS
jgi:hypothetical protein